VTTGGSGGGGTAAGDAGNSGLFGDQFGNQGTGGDGAAAAPGGGLGAAGTAAGNAATGITSLLPNIQAWFDEWIAKQANALNQILNTGWYGTIAVGGIILMGTGLYLLAKDVAAPGSTGLGDAVGKLAGVANLGMAIADPAVGAAAYVGRKVLKK